MAIRYGYACINMTLRQQRITTNRGMIRRTFDSKGLEYVSEIVLLNLRDQFEIIKWNEEHNIKLYRMSGSLFPWMSEYEFKDLPKYDEIKKILAETGKFAMDHGQRLTFHPGQFCVLCSPTEQTVKNAIVELDRHSQIMDMLGLPASPEAKINIHVGGAYGDKKSALKRWCKNFKRLEPNTQKRLVIENDDKASMYSVKDLYEGIYKKIGVPITFDYYHHKFCTGGLSEEEALHLAAKTWPEGIRQCTHYSESRRNEQKASMEMLCENNNIDIALLENGNDDDWPTLSRIYKDWCKTKEQAHSDYITQEPNCYGLDIDCVVEAKAKELSIIKYINQDRLAAQLLTENEKV